MELRESQLLMDHFCVQISWIPKSFSRQDNSKNEVMAELIPGNHSFSK